MSMKKRILQFICYVKNNQLQVAKKKEGKMIHLLKLKQREVLTVEYLQQ